MNLVLKMRILEVGITQKELADRVGASQAAISQIVQGKTKPNLDLALAIAKELKTTVEALWG